MRVSRRGEDIRRFGAAAWRRWPSIMLAALIVVLGTLLDPRASHAQAAPSDVAHTGDVNLTLPDLPEGFVSETIGDVEWSYPRAAESLVLDLQDAYREGWPRVVGDLGGDIDTELVVRVGRDPREMAALAPREAPPPGYAVGVAYPDSGIILLTLSAPETWERPDIDRVLVHELSHVAVHRAVDGQPLPRWFSEGLAIFQARENSIERIQTLWTNSVAGNVVPLASLDDRFPRAPHRVNGAYAQSADIVRFLREGEGGERDFRQLIRAIRQGMPFEEAVQDSYHEPLSSLELRWHESLEERFHALPLFASGTGLWSLIAGLLVFATMRNRRRKKRRLAEMEAQERAEAEAELAANEHAVLQALANAQPDDIMLVIPPDHAGEGDIPTVEYNGQNHTLH
jgi:hypothetical protein